MRISPGNVSSRCFCVGLLLIFLWPSFAAAQPFIGGLSRTTRPSPTPFLPVPRELQRELDRARKDIQEKRFVDAITRLDLILGGGETDNEDDASELAEDYFVRRTDRSLGSLKLEAERTLSTMPRAGLEAYELAHGTDARQVFNRAIGDRDFDLIGEISRRYGNTQAGQDATMILGREALRNGDVLQAVMHFQRLRESTVAAERFGAELQLLLATSLEIANRSSAAREVLDQQRIVDQGIPVRVAGKEVSWFKDDGQALEWLSATTGEIGSPTEQEIVDWPLFGGNAKRAANTTAGMPLKSMRWDLPVAPNRDEPKQLERHAKSLREKGVTPSMHPLAVGNWLLMRSTDHLWGVDIETGSRVWTYPWTKGPTRYGSQSSYASNDARRTNLIRKRVWDDSLYGQISSDGKSVFLLDDLTSEYHATRNPGGLSNKMVALDLEKQGYLLWSVGGNETDSEPKLAGVFFLGPPLPVGDEVFCVGEQNGEIRLFALDAAAGNLVWSQQIALINTTYRNSGVQRRMAGLNLCYADGILLCPTSVGGIVAIDPRQRAFRWGFEYGGTAKRTGYARSVPQGDRWRDNSLVVGEGKVIVTAWDTSEVNCLDLLTGKSVWPAPRKRDKLIYTAGVHDGNVILVGTESVTAANLETGKTVWTLPLTSAPAGRGVQSGSTYLLSTVAPDLLQIDLDKGEILASHPTDEALGNLIVARDFVFSQNEKRLRSFFQREKLEQRVESALTANRQDPWALEHNAILALEDGRREEALQFLRQAIAGYPNDGSGSSIAAEQLLVNTSLEMLRDNVPGATFLAKEIEPLIERQSKTRKEFLRVMTMNLRREGQIVEAFRRNLTLFEREAATQRDRIVRDRVELMPVTRQLKMHQERWHRTLFRDLWNDASDSQRVELAAMGRAALDSATPLELPGVVNVLQDLPFAVEALMAVLSEQISNDLITATTETRLLRIADSGDSEFAVQALVELAGLYSSRQLPEAAAQIVRRLRDQHADAMLADGQSAGEFVDELLLKHDAVREQVEGLLEWKFGRAKVTQLRETPRVIAGRINPTDTLTQTLLLDTEQPLGQQLPGRQLVLSNQTNKVLQMRDALGNVRAIATLNSILRGSRSRDVRVRTNGHYIVASRGEAVVAINALAAGDGAEEAIVWQEGGASVAPYGSTTSFQTIRFGDLGLDLGRTIESTRTVSGLALGPVTSHGIIVRRYSDLICLDPETGDAVWSRDDVDMTSEVWGDEDYVFVHAPGKPLGNDRNARVFSTMDGRELESRPVPGQRSRLRMFGQRALSFDWNVGGELPDPEDVLQLMLSSELKSISNAKAPVPDDAMVHSIQMKDLLKRGNAASWRKELGAGSKAALIGNSELAVYDPREKKIQILRLDNGELIVDHPVEMGDANVRSIHVEKRAGMYVVTLGENTTRKPGGKTIYKSPGGTQTRVSNLFVYTFDQQGELAWEVPAKLKNFIQGRFFADDVPIMVFMRVDQSKSKQLQTVILDVRDGHVLHMHTGPFVGSAFQVRGDLERNEVFVRVPASDGNWKIEFTDEPRAPAPPYGYATQTKREKGSVFGKALSALRNVFSDTESPATPDAEDDGLFDR